MPQHILALEITDAELKAAVVETSFRDYRVSAFFREPLSAAAGPVADQVRRFVEQHALTGYTVLSALPGDQVTWRTFALPFRDRKRLAQTIPFELENHVPFGLDEAIVDYQVLHRDSDGTTVLAALVPKPDLVAHLELLRAAGLDPKVVALGPLATVNALTLVPDLPPAFVFVDLGTQHVTVALYRNGELAGLRTIIPVGSGSATGNGTGATGPHGAAGEVEALLRELRWTVLALNGGPLAVDLPCYMAGAAVDLDAVQPGVADHLGVEVRRLDRIRFRTLPPETAAQAPAFTASLGLALREVAPTTTLGLNFRRDEFTYHRTQQELRRSLRSVAALAATLVALTVTDLYLGYRQQAVRVENLDAQIRWVFSETLQDVQKITNPTAQLQEEVDALQKNIDLLNGIVPVASSTSLDILNAISAAVPKGVRVETDEYIMDADAVRLRGNTDNFEAVDSMKRQWAASGFFSDVKVNDARAAKSGRGVDFRMTLTFTKDFRPREGQS